MKSSKVQSSNNPTLFKTNLVAGWDEGIVGMQVGGERRLTIPPNMAYGKKVQSGIPANSTLIFGMFLFINLR